MWAELRHSRHIRRWLRPNINKSKLFSESVTACVSVDSLSKFIDDSQMLNQETNSKWCEQGLEVLTVTSIAFQSWYFSAATFANKLASWQHFPCCSQEEYEILAAGRFNKLITIWLDSVCLIYCANFTHQSQLNCTHFRKSRSSWYFSSF